MYHLKPDKYQTVCQNVTRTLKLDQFEDWTMDLGKSMFTFGEAFLLKKPNSCKN